jgi:hypothetical protein
MTVIQNASKVTIQIMIDASQQIGKVNTQRELDGMNPAVKKHYELQIKTLHNAPIEM